MNVEDMDVFKLSHRMVQNVYKLTGKFPDLEKFGLTSQMRRAVSSICMNLVEGSHRIGKNEYKHFVSIARGSCGEVKYQVLLSKDLGYIGMEDYRDITEHCDRISMMLLKLYRSLA